MFKLIHRSLKTAKFQHNRLYGSHSSANQMTRAMNKLSIGSKSKRNKWHIGTDPSNLLPSSTLINKKGMGKAGIRRSLMLNKLFMKNITDLMATGEISEQLLGKGIQISNVKVSPDFNIVNVYWVAQGSESDNEIEELLKKAAGAIKHELSSIRVMGVVPHICFVKDKKQSLVAEVEKLLKIAEYPEDHTPTEIASRLKEEFELQTGLPEHLVNKIQALDNKLDGDDIIDESMPEMRHDVFGLDQKEIMKKVSRDVEKVKIAWEEYGSMKSRRNESVDEDQVREKSEREVIMEKFNKYVQMKEFIQKPKRRYLKTVDSSYTEEIYDDPENFRDDDFIEENDDFNPSKR